MRASRVIAGALLLGQVAACSKMRTVPEPLPYMRAARPAQLWVTPAGGLETVLLAPTLVGDSILAWDEMGQQTMLPLEELNGSLVRTREFDLTRTALLATGIAGLAVAAGFAVFGGYAVCDDGGPSTNQRSNCPGRPHDSPDFVDPQFKTAAPGLRISIP